MLMKILRKLPLLIFIIGASFSLAAPIYTVTIVSLPGGLISSVGGMNASGQVAGYFVNSSGQYGLFVGQPGNYTVLPNLTSAYQSAYGLANNGQVFGFLQGTGSFVWSQQTGYTSLGVIPGYLPTDAGAQGQNSAGVVVGSIAKSPSDGKGVVWVNGIPQIIPGTGVIYGINDSSQVVGAFNLFGAAPFYGTLGGSLNPITTPFPYSNALAINNQGTVVGIGYYGSPMVTSVWVLSGGNLTVLPMLPGYTSFGAVSSASINNKGQVVGDVFNSATSSLGIWLWSASTGLVDLNQQIPAGWHLTDAKVINDAGQILAAGYFNGSYYSVRLDPIVSSIPEPQGWSLFGLPLLAIAIVRWHRC